MFNIRAVRFFALAAIVCVAGWSASYGTEQKTVNKTSHALPSNKLGAVIHPDWSDVPLDLAAERGIRWLVSVQGRDGGWGQDGGYGSKAWNNVNFESNGNDVANTSMVALALLRSGTTPKQGAYREALNAAINFILSDIEAAQEAGLAITNRNGTQIQRKLGPYIDTFLATLLLSEIDGQMPDESLQKRARAALRKCIAKIEKNQQLDGSWNIGGGWAPVIGTSLASRGLYRAQAKGVAVETEVLRKVDNYTRSNFDAQKGEFKAASAGAGVELYQAAQALEQATRSADSRKANAPMTGAAIAKLSADSFIRGFGSMGGEEFVSYFNISDSLLRTGGKEWSNWNNKIKTHLAKLQNQDGTWAGHHCITGRVTCTSAAVMTLIAERTVAKTT